MKLIWRQKQGSFKAFVSNLHPFSQKSNCFYRKLQMTSKTKYSMVFVTEFFQCIKSTRKIQHSVFKYSKTENILLVILKIMDALQPKGDKKNKFLGILPRSWPLKDKNCDPWKFSAMERTCIRGWAFTSDLLPISERDKRWYLFQQCCRVCLSHRKKGVKSSYVPMTLCLKPSVVGTSLIPSWIQDG